MLGKRRFWCIFALLLSLELHVSRAHEQEENPLLEAARSLLENSLSGKDGPNGASIIQGIGSMLGSKDGGGMAEMIGSMLAGAAQGGGAGADPSILTNLVDMLANSAGNKDDSKSSGGGGGIDMEAMLGMASAFMSAQQGSDSSGGGTQTGGEALLSLLPLVMQASQGGGNIFDTGMAMWRQFSHSEFAQTLWKSSGMHKITARFLDNEGNFDIHRVFESLQNHQFRRTWIRGLTAFVADWLSHIADPASQARYTSMARGLLDGFMRSHGLAPFDPTRPGNSLSTLANALLRRHLGSRADATPYVKPAVEYLWELFQIGRSKSEGLGLAKMPPREIEARMAEALNDELIEPVLRVWRAFRFARSRPQCGRYVLCEVAREAQEMPGVGLKPGATKLASLVATWYLADDAHTSFWTLYSAATASTECQEHFISGCDEFLAVDREATTKYIHNEL